MLDILIDELTQDATAEELLKDGRLPKRLNKRLGEIALEAEMSLDFIANICGSPDWI